VVLHLLLLLVLLVLLQLLLFLQLVQITLEEMSELTGGVRGLKVPQPTVFEGQPLNYYSIYLVVLVVCGLSILVTRNLLASRIGRELNAVRTSPHASQALGVSVDRVKLIAFALAAGYAGLAGGLLAVVVGFIDPNEFGVSAALKQITFIVVGGLGYDLGCMWTVIGLALEWQ
jgi:branched-chain amino acid transport system permease protein